MYDLARHPVSQPYWARGKSAKTQRYREIERRLRILKHAEETGHVGRTCQCFGIGRASFYRWKAALEEYGEAGLVRKKPIPKNPRSRTPPEIVEKVLHLRKTYHQGPMRIVWYLTRYHDIKTSEPEFLVS